MTKILTSTVASCAASRSRRARWKRCVQATDAGLGEALSQVYVSQEFPPANKQATLQMVKDIEAAMDQDIDTLDWMSSATKVRAKEKLHAVADKIGYPDHWRDYSSLTVARDDAFGNALRATEFESRRQLAKIGKPVDRGEWLITPATVDAYYNPSMNDINFPAGILQPPLYDSHASDASNYGHIGGVVGHELTHGFDDEGRQFDANGNLADWWTAEDGKKFDEKADCEVKEYGNFVAVDDVKVNGKLTLGENTADNGGLRLAYIAFLADAKRKNIDLTKKQDGYTPIQQFFLGHGQSWCGSTRPEQLTAASADRSALAAPIPGERRSAKHARVRSRFRLQDRTADDAGECLSGLVSLPPCLSKERRDEDGAPAVTINEMERRASPPVFLLASKLVPFPYSIRILLRRRSRRSGCSRRDLGSDHVAGNDHLHTAIQLPSLGGAVIGDRVSFTQATSDYVVDRDVVVDQIVAHRRGPLFRQCLVVGVAADAVGVTFNFQTQIRIRQNDA